MPKNKLWLPSGVKRYLDTANTQIRRREEHTQKLAKLIPKGSFYWYLPRHGAFKAKLNQLSTIGSIQYAVEMLPNFLWMDERYCVLPDHIEQVDKLTSGKDQTMSRSPFTIAPTLFHNNPNQVSLLYFQ